MKTIPMLFFVLAITAAPGLTRAGVCTNKHLFDATLFKGKPGNEVAPVLENLDLVYSSQLWPAGNDRSAPPAMETLTKVLSPIGASEPNTLLILDIENWPLTGPEDRIRKSIELFRETARRVKAVLPKAKIGFYGIPPIPDYWRAIQPKGSAARNSWEAQSELMRPLAAELDAAFPSLYAHYNDPKGWSSVAEAQIETARHLMPGKPVYPFLWFKFHDSNRQLTGKDLPSDYWREQLQFSCQHADGFIVWGGYAETWSSSAPWWQEVKRVKSN
jgi:hypothetical protein